MEILCSMASLVVQRLKRLPAMWETWVWSLCRGDPLERELATHSSILTWRIPWTGGAWWATVHGSQRVRHDWRTSLSLIAQIAPTLATGSPFCCFCVPLTNSRNFGSLALPYFLAQGDVPDSSCMFQDIALDSAISPSSSCCFYWKRVFKNQDLGWLCSMLLECCWV